MYYRNYDDFSALTEERLFEIVKRGVNQYLDEVKTYMQTQQETIDALTEENTAMGNKYDALMDRHAELVAEVERLREENTRLAAENARLTTDPVVYMCDEIKVDRAEFVGASFGTMYDIHGNRSLEFRVEG